MPGYEYAFDFSRGFGPWTSWMSPSLIRNDPGAHDSFVRVQAPGALDPNHIDGIGSLSLVAHLSAPIVGSPGIFDLRNAEIEITIKGSDFDPNGSKLCFWIVTYIPELDLTLNFPFGLQSTNWAHTAGDFADDVTDEWQTFTLQLSDDSADWTYAGNWVTNQGDWAHRYEFLDLSKALSAVDATLHLVTISDSPDQRPTGFLDIAGITVRTNDPAGPIPVVQPHFVDYGVEDELLSGQLTPPSGTIGPLTYALVNGSAQNGSAGINSATGEYSFTPNPDYYGPTDAVGPARFQYTVTDSNGTSGPLTAYLYIAPINDAPSAASLDEGFTIAANEPFAHSLFKGADIDGDVLTFEIVPGSVENGTLDLDPRTGRYVFTPAAGFSGEAGFEYVVSDGQLESAPKTVTLVIAPAGNPPVLPTFAEVIDTYLLQGDFTGFVRWTIRLADAGDVDASYHYGTWLNAGLNVTKNTALAAHFLEIATAVSEDAVLQLAMLYSTGDGVARDYGMARQLYASLPYSAEAHYRLALLDGLGFGAATLDAVAAGNNFIEAARLGNADAMYTLGRRYLVGDGVPESPADAYYWLGVGLREGGGPDFPVFDDFLESNMALAAAHLSPSEIAALDAEIAAWQPGIILQGNGTLIGSGFADTLVGAELSDYLIGAAGDDRLVGGSGVANALQGGTGDDIYVVSLAGDTITEFTGEGTDTVETTLATLKLREYLEDLTYVGEGDFVGTGNALDNVLTGGGGADRLSGAGGTNLLVGGGGLDAADYSAAPNAVTVKLNGGITQANGYGGTDALSQIENVIGSALNDILIGDAGANRLEGGLGSDTLIGLDGDDVLVGGSGAANALQGGHGNDLYILAATGDSVTEFAGGGSDTVETDLASHSLKAEVENLTYTGVGNFTGIGNAAANLITGRAGSDYLIGLGGDDVLVGGSGAANALQGGLGNDTFVVSVAGDTIIEFAGQGADTIRTDLAAYTLKANVENLVYTGAGAFTGIGNELANVLTGGAGNDVLDGRLGDDSVLGGLGDDRLIGGGGNNALAGGTGVDSADYSAATAVVKAQLNGGIATANGFGGADTLSEIENLVGSAFNDVLIGNAGSNRLMGGGGSDVLVGLDGDDVLDGGSSGAANELQGGLGNDTYIVALAGDSITEFAGEGVDKVETLLASYVLKANLENLTFAGTGAFTCTGNDLANVITGGAGGDLLNGGLGNDILIGLGGADLFIFTTAPGLGNIDTITGFAAGSDRIAVENAVFAGLANGVLAAGAFVVGSAAADADDRIIYNPATGAVLFDVDGIGGAAAVQFATVDPGLPLTAGDFAVI